VFVHKITATQASGPFTIGGVCIASVLAFEIASQLEAAGHQVDQLILIDAPTQPYLASCKAPLTLLRHPSLLAQRVAKIGIRNGVVHLCRRYLKRFWKDAGHDRSRTDREIAHELIEDAAFAYFPRTYRGRTLLILSAKCIPLLDFYPGWRAVIADQLHACHVDGQHREFITSRNVAELAKIIADELTTAWKSEAKPGAQPIRDGGSTALSAAPAH
jgi:thioesterase domain-containing protein